VTKYSRLFIALIAATVMSWSSIACADWQTQAPTPVRPPVSQGSADCQRPTYATDRLVCSDMGLAKLDASLARLLADLPHQSDSSDAPWLETQDAWFKRRSLCAFEENHSGCARQAYRIRIAELQAIVSMSGVSKPLRCPSLPGAVAFTAMEDGLLVIRDGEGKVLLLAWPGETSPWRPFIVYRWKKAKLHLARQGDKAALTCR
jgi:uncharacterized protein YecT (DUF1311 family)